MKGFQHNCVVLIAVICSGHAVLGIDFTDNTPSLFQIPRPFDGPSSGDIANNNPIRDRSDLGKTEYFDLSYTFDDDTIFYPVQRFDYHLLKDVGPTVNVTSDGSYRFSYAAYSFCMSEHGGTHMDAPFHFNKFGWKLAEIPINRLVDVPAVIVDVETHVFSLRQPDQFILQVGHILEHESKFGKIPSGAVVLVRYGWGKFWPDKQRYMGWDNSTAGLGGRGFTLNFPGMSVNAANWLVRERQIVGFGSDTMSADKGNDGGHFSDQFVHIALLENQVYIIENVAYLDNLLRKTRPHNYHQSNQFCNQLRLHVLPMKTFGTGGPVRVVAYCKSL